MRQETSLKLQELDGERQYEAELAKCNGVTGFHRWFFLHALSEALGLRLRAFAVEADGERLGVLPILLRRRGPIATANYLPVPHVGPLLRDRRRLTDMLRAVEPYLVRQLVVVVKWSFAPGVTVDPEQLSRRGFEVSQQENFFVPADRSPEEYLRALSPKVYRAIKRGQSVGMHAGPSTLEEVIEWFPERVNDPYARQGIAPDYDAVAARHLAERLATDPRMLWRSIRSGNQLLAVYAAIVESDRVWGWMAVGERAHKPSPFLISYWDIIEWSLSRGLACDFGGAPTGGIRDFKIRMGGKVEHCITAERVRPRAYRTARALYAHMSRPG